LRTHVAVCKLEPSAGKSICKFVRIIEEAPGYLFINGIKPQRQVRCEHRGSMTTRRIVCVRYGIGTHAVFRLPLPCAGRTLHKFPLITKEVPEEVVGPFRRRRSPRAFQTAGDGVHTVACAESVFPAEAHFFNS